MYGETYGQANTSVAAQDALKARIQAMIGEQPTMGRIDAAKAVILGAPQRPAVGGYYAQVGDVPVFVRGFSGEVPTTNALVKILGSEYLGITTPHKRATPLPEP